MQNCVLFSLEILALISTTLDQQKVNKKKETDKLIYICNKR